MNVENIRALAKKLRRLRHEEHYDQSGWVEKTSCGTAACIAGHAALLAGYKPFLTPGCSDFTCFESNCKRVSHTTFHSEKMKDSEGKAERVDTIAKRFLGVAGAKARQLFSGEPDGAGYDKNCNPVSETAWPAEYAKRWASAKGGDPAAGCERPSRVAADLLDAIADGKVKL